MILDDILDRPTRLSSDQRKAVTSENRHIRIVAGAGAGKTETLTRRIVYLLLVKKASPASIVAFTFTKRAARSIKDRVYERMLNLRGEESCARLGEMFIGTIHAFCGRVLMDHFEYGDRSVLDDNQEMAFVMREGWNLGLGKGGRFNDNCADFLKSVNVVYDNLVDRALLKDGDEAFLRHLDYYEELLDEHRLLTFGRLIAVTLDKLVRHRDVLTGIEHLIVDEYQDINRAQERLIALLGESASIFVVGDPRQCIYQWRGSDERCFDDFLRRFPAAEKVSIRDNRRSAQSIVRAANTFAGTFAEAKYDDLLPARSDAGLACAYRAETEADEADWIAEQIRLYVEEERICRFSDIAILLRSVTTSAQPFLDVLRSSKYNFPFIVGGKVGLFKRTEAQMVGRVFAWLGDNFWVEEPHRWRDAVEGEELFDSVVRCWRATFEEEQVPSGLTDSLVRFKERVVDGEYENFSDVYHDLLVILGFLRLDPSDKLSAAVMANLGRFNSLLLDYESSIRVGGHRLDWRKALKGLCWYMNTYATGAYEEQQSEDLRGVDAVSIMTIHQAKGLEWPIVFVPCMVGTRFPSRNAGRKQRWLVPCSVFDVGRYEGSEEDERRLCYVAITRARDVLVLSRFMRKKVSIPPSKFLSGLDHTIEELEDGVSLPIVKLDVGESGDELQSFTTGELVLYSRCPHMYRLRELWGFQSGIVSELGYGNSLHHCLRLIANRVKAGDQAEKAIDEVLDTSFHLPFAGERQLEDMRNGARSVLRKYVLGHLADLQDIEEVESRVEFPLHRVTVTGRADVIMRSGGSSSVEVRDYKTSDAVTTYEESALQVRLYCLGLAALGRSVGSASIAYLDTGELRAVPVGRSDLLAAKEECGSLVTAMLSHNFERRDGDNCRSCDYRKICTQQN